VVVVVVAADSEASMPESFGSSLQVPLVKSGRRYVAAVDQQYAGRRSIPLEISDVEREASTSPSHWARQHAATDVDSRPRCHNSSQIVCGWLRDRRTDFATLAADPDDFGSCAAAAEFDAVPADHLDAMGPACRQIVACRRTRSPRKPGGRFHALADFKLGHDPAAFFLPFMFTPL
jgi:hypothetical protein